MEKLRGFEIAKGFENAGINLPVRKTKCSAGYDFEAAGNVSVTVSYTIGDATYKIYSGAAGEESFPLDIGGADSISGLSEDSGTFTVMITDSEGQDVTSSFNTSGLSASFTKE